MYRLTMQEMRVLHAGYRATQQAKQDKQNGVDPSDREGLRDFNERLQADESESTNEGVL